MKVKKCNESYIWTVCSIIMYAPGRLHVVFSLSGSLRNFALLKVVIAATPAQASFLSALICASVFTCGLNS